MPGDVLRFEHGGHTYAIYRTQIGQLFASDGFCTHGRAQLADGFLQGTCIECPKHNGRFDIRDGSVRRPPPRRPLRTYEVREKGGKVLLKVAAKQGSSTEPDQGVDRSFEVPWFRQDPNRPLKILPDDRSPEAIPHPAIIASSRAIALLAMMA